jgi:hypothetical protein
MTIDLTFEGLNLATAGNTTVLRIMLEGEIILVKSTKDLSLYPYFEHCRGIQVCF